MSSMAVSYKPLSLSEEEALALLDLCVASQVETNPINERALRKLVDLVRSYLAEETAKCTPSELRVEEWHD